MTISFTRYVNISSGVAGQDQVPARSLGGRIFTDNVLLPPQTMVTFGGGPQVALASCGEYFGTDSPEYARALFYFSWVSKLGTQAQQIDFARWVDTAVAPMIFGIGGTPSLAALQNITAGQFTMVMGGVSHTFGPFNFSALESFAAVATAVQTAINLASGALWSAATVSYDAGNGAFNFVGGQATSSGYTAISVTDGAQSVAAALGWLPAATFMNNNPSTGAIYAEGAGVEDVVAMLSANYSASNNFGSFLFMPTLTQDDVVAAAEWNAALNVSLQFTVAVSAGNAAAWSAATVAIEGCELSLVAGTEFAEMPPMNILAATPYNTGANVSQNYMFQQFDLPPSVTTDADANTYDALRVNYYGQTQVDGEDISFYQRGVMMGGASAPVDMNTYANEQWLKSSIGAAFMNLQLALPELPANTQGRILATGALQGVIGSTTTPGTALYNGVISVGKPLNAAQTAAITQYTNDPNAWRQVQNSGYWYSIVIAPYTNAQTGLPEYEITYTLVYSKNDSIRLVTGTDVLI